MLVEFQPEGKFRRLTLPGRAGRFERRTSVLEEALSTVRAKLADNLSKFEKLTTPSDVITLDRIPEEGALEVRVHNNAVIEARIAVKPLFCTLSLLEPDTPQNKLEVVFHVYDSDANGFLDKIEIDGIIEQMMNVARHQQWDTIELEPILRQMMADIDSNNDGIVSWRNGGEEVSRISRYSFCWVSI
ncbi:hypothetical protein OSTOST_15245, partial [Ostertagia ostertagi]